MLISYNPFTGEVTGWATDNGGIGGVTITAELPADFRETMCDGSNKKYCVNPGTRTLEVSPGWVDPSVNEGGAT